MSPLLTQYLVVGFGGALGTMARLALSSFVDTSMQRTGPLFPWGTILVNITGCFIIGFVATVTATEGRLFVGTLGRQFIMIGILGGYTTFSSFSMQTLLLVQDGEWGHAAANVLISVIFCLIGVWLGAVLGSLLNQMR